MSLLANLLEERPEFSHFLMIFRSQILSLGNIFMEVVKRVVVRIQLITVFLIEPLRYF